MNKAIKSKKISFCLLFGIYRKFFTLLTITTYDKTVQNCSKKMNRRWICSDVWMDILPSFDHAQLGLKMALLSDRFDVLVDTHFDGKTTELTLWNYIRIDKDEGPELKLSVLIDGTFMAFPMPDRPLPNKIRFKHLNIIYIDHSVIAFLRSNKQIWDRMGTNLELSITNVQRIWDVFVRETWPIFATNIRHLSFAGPIHLDKLRRLISPTILTDLDHLNSIDSYYLLPAVIADDGPNATAGQMLSKWLNTPNKNGQPKRLHCYDYFDGLNLEWVNDLKEAFLRATNSSVSYIIRIDHVRTMPTEPFESVNERTKEKLTLEKVSSYDDVNWLLKRCPITATIQWENDKNCDDNLNNVKFTLWRCNNSIGPLSPSTEEKADQSNQNVV